MLSAFNCLACKKPADCGHAREHDVRELLHQEIRQRQMKRRIQSREAPRENSAYDENGAEQSQHTLKIGHDTLPLSGAVVDAAQEHVSAARRRFRPDSGFLSFSAVFKA
jgi:hypothetical protein